MQSRNRVFDDIARVTNGAASVFSGFRDEAEAKLRQQLERLLADTDVVPREEFEAVREIAANARREQELLTARVAELEARIVELGKSAAPKRKAHKRAADTIAGEAADASDDAAEADGDTGPGA
ncbi:MAG: accessory factor UbiK family protein [Alphaproteobacteria bacterium]